MILAQSYGTAAIVKKSPHKIVSFAVVNLFHLRIAAQFPEMIPTHLLVSGAFGFVRVLNEEASRRLDTCLSRGDFFRLLSIGKLLGL